MSNPDGSSYTAMVPPRHGGSHTQNSAVASVTPQGSAVPNRVVPLTFAADGSALIGVLHLPPQPPATGVVIVVGGPQYRVGSHRQFVLMARYLAAQGIAVLRFDCRGMGDSGGNFPGFERIAGDIRAAIDALLGAAPSIRSVVLWGLCDAATAIAMYASEDERITGVILLNPWIRSEATQARTHLRHYYAQRLCDPLFWRRVMRLEFRPIRSARGLIRDVLHAVGTPARAHTSIVAETAGPLAERMAAGLQKYRGAVLLIISGRDLTAKEFEDAAQGSRLWRRLLADSRITRHDLAEADHTFSRCVWRDQVAAWTEEWVRVRSTDQYS